MSTDLLVKKLSKEVIDLRKEMQRMQKMLITAITDSEGVYRSSFVKKILAREKEKAPFHFSEKISFLQHVRGK